MIILGFAAIGFGSIEEGAAALVEAVGGEYESVGWESIGKWMILGGFFLAILKSGYTTTMSTTMENNLSLGGIQFRR